MTPHEPVSRRSLVAYFSVAVLLSVLLAAGVSSHFDRKAADRTRAENADRVATQILGCQRGISDRTDQARAFTAIANYYDNVTRAESVKQDVRDLAANVRDVVNQSAASLRSRLLECDPLIIKHVSIPDQEALRDALGGPSGPTGPEG